MADLKNLQKVLDQIEQLNSDLDELLDTGLSSLERTALKEATELIKDLKTGNNGEIKLSQENLKKIRQISRKLDRKTGGKEIMDFKKKVENLYNEYNSLLSTYVTLIGGKFEGGTISVKIEAGIENALSYLNRETISEVQSKMVERLVRKNMIEGKSVADLISEAKEQLTGDKGGALTKHVSTHVRDTIRTAQRSAVNEATEGVKLEFYQFSGSIIATSRPMCREMIKHRYFHESEIKDLIKGKVKGKQTPLTKDGLPLGMKEETEVSNYPVLVNGWNCSHDFIKVPSAFVPKAIRDQFA